MDLHFSALSACSPVKKLPADMCVGVPREPYRRKITTPTIATAATIPRIHHP
jgi:hypothetical protein